MGKEEAGRKALELLARVGLADKAEAIRDSSPADRSRGWPSRVPLP